jgi:hypothetical protein
MTLRLMSVATVEQKYILKMLHAANGNCSFEMNKVVLTLILTCDLENEHIFV